MEDHLPTTSEACLRTVLNVTSDGVLVFDRRGVIRLANPAAVRLLGVAAAELRGRNLLEFSLPGQRFNLSREFARFCREPESSILASGVELRARRRDGRELLLYCRLGRIESGAENCYLALLRDITGLREIHEKLARAKHLASLGEMGASIAHEIRNPLAGINGAVQVLAGMADPADPQYPVLMEVQRLTERIESTVAHLLEYARDWQPEPRLCEIVDLVESVVGDYRRQRDLKGVTIRIESQGRPRALVDPELIGQVLENLMDNAIYACPEEGGVLVWRLRRSQREVFLILEDNGPGVDDGIRGNIFKPFFTTREQGYGLGLAICQKIIEKHNGTIVLENRREGGARAVITLPKSKFLKA